MNIRLTPEQEKLIQEEMKDGHFRSVEELIAKALEALREKERSSAVGEAKNGQREAVREMLEFVEKNRTRLDEITVRALIHEGHRL